MNFRKRLISVLTVLVVLAAIYVIGSPFWKKGGGYAELMDFRKETIRVWYTDDALTDYLNSKALEFYESNDIRVETTLVSGLEYLEAINTASLQGEEAPDVYLLSNDSLEKAYLAGLAAEISQKDIVSDTARYSQTAQNAVTYNGKLVGYPFYFETSTLLYNKTYLEQSAIAAVLEERPELAPVDGDTAQTSAGEESETSEVTLNQLSQEAVDLVLAKEKELVPASIADILNFADQYSAPENVESIFKWDVSDIFYNYFFIGNYITVGGSAGDNKNQIDIYNTDAIASLKVYQELNQFFSIDTKEVSYDTIMQEFLEGKIIYTIATSDCLKKLEEAQENGEFPYEYAVAGVPDINAQMHTKGMSVTNALVVNGYSEHKEEANQFALSLTDSSSSELYERTGKIPARIQDSYKNDNIAVFAETYTDTIPMPKMIETSNFWVELEICFAKVWGGADANTEIKALSEQIMTQLIGEDYVEVPLEDPQVELLPAVEYEDTGIGE